MNENSDTIPERLLRRAQAAKYVVETYNVPCSPKTLAKLACVSSDGGLRSDSQDASRSIPPPASTSGRKARSARWFDRPRKYGALPKPHKRKNPAARFLGGISVHGEESIDRIHGCHDFKWRRMAMQRGLDRRW